MRNRLLVVPVVLLPFAIFVVVSMALSAATDVEPARAAAKRAQPAVATPLNQRLRGYSADDAAAFWGAIRDSSATGLHAERRFLQVDLAFPLVYAGLAFALGRLAAQRWLGVTIPVRWLAVVLVVTAVADWTENLVQLPQLALFQAGHTLQPAAIRIASLATQVKLVGFTLAQLLYMGLVIRGRA